MRGISADHNPTAELDTMNRALADLLQREPAALASGAGAALADELVVCGLLGGKDVGKSTLVNALAQEAISVDRREVGRGTERPLVYVHEAMRETVEDRLRVRNAQEAIDIATHEADPIRNVALVDLPDFDSELSSHRAVVRTVTPVLDRVLWVFTPRKIGDRVAAEMLQDVLKAPANVYWVLNKLDELLSDADPFPRSSDPSVTDFGRPKPFDQVVPRGLKDPEAETRAERFWRDQHGWMARSIPAAGRPQGEGHRFLVAAAYSEPEQFIGRIGELWNDPDWSRYEADRSAVLAVARRNARELDRLRVCVLSPVSREEGRAIKAANRRQVEQANVARIKRHYDLDLLVERLSRACDPDYYQQAMSDVLGRDYAVAVAESLRGRLQPAATLADELLERRVSDWPLLRLVHWPFGWLSRALGRTRGFNPRLARASPEDRPGPAGEPEPFDAAGSSLVDRIESLRARILADHAVVTVDLDLERQMPSASELAGRVREAGRKLPVNFDARLLDELRRRDRGPSLLRRAALWLILLWFPLLQPVLAGLLEMFSEEGTWNLAHGLYRIVTALSAVHLLTGLAVVAAVYVAVLAAMYARTLRAVRRFRTEQGDGWPLADAVDEILVTEVAGPLAKPFQTRLEPLAALKIRLDQQASGHA